MFSGILANVAREQASILRDAESITENFKDSQIQEAILIKKEAMPIRLWHVFIIIYY